MATNGSAKKVAILGGGITGLTVAYDLMRQSPGQYEVTIFEAAPQLGGLAAGFKGRKEWEWALEYYYHHLFTSDKAMFQLVKEIGFGDSLKIYRPNTAIHSQGVNYPLDSVTRILRFPLIPFIDRLRMGMAIAWLRYSPTPSWQQYDKMTADRWLRQWMGSTAYEAAWEFQLEGKFGEHYKEINMAWMWARVFTRTPQLAYFDGGFQAFADHFGSYLRQQGVQIHLNTPVESIKPNAEGGYELGVRNTKYEIRNFDLVLSTVSPNLMQKLTPDLPTSYLSQLHKLKSMGAVVLTVAIKQKLTDDMYWISLPKREGIPLLAMVEHTNMIDPRHYAGDHLLYLGNYLEPDHPYFEMSVDQLLAEFTPHLSKFNPEFRPNWVTGAWVHRAKYAQPIPPVGYLELIPDIRTPLPGLYFASMSQVYPYDRGTNYAVEMGHKVAGMIRGG
ncbi:MAG: NAD(P)/FAD-dependent oxidoreductase [Caldilineaceae bacterium]